MAGTAPNFDDWRAICDIKARYCRLLDTKQWDRWADEVFTEDLVMDTSAAGGPSPVHGRAECIAMVRANIENARTAHQVHNPEITMAGSDAADVIWAMQDRVVFEGGAGLVGYGQYIETYARRNGEWRIATTKLTRFHLDLTAAPA